MRKVKRATDLLRRGKTTPKWEGRRSKVRKGSAKGITESSTGNWGEGEGEERERDSKGKRNEREKA